jgi:hypothetical protein
MFRYGAVTALVAASLTVGGCHQHTQAERLIPDHVDFVVAFTPSFGSGPATAKLRSGSSISVDREKILLVEGLPVEGTMVILGSVPRPWLLTVGREPSRDCFWINGWGTEEDSSIVLDKGPVLPESPNFDRGSVGYNEHRFERSGFCLNEQGQVTSVRL